MIKKLRKFHTAKELAKIYATPHDHAIYGRGHGIRVNTTIQLAKDMAYQAEAKSVADLSCGNGAIVKALNVEKTILGDYAEGHEYSGPLEVNLKKIECLFYQLQLMLGMTPTKSTTGLGVDKMLKLF
jgi:hypothetical protein